MHAFKTENEKELIFKNRQALHGDVIIERVDSLPKDFTQLEKEPNDTLAYGDVTNHSHKLFRMTDPDMPGSCGFELRQTPDGIKFLHVEKPVCLRHQEHDPRIIPPGNYKITIQREWDPFTKLARRVQD